MVLKRWSWEIFLKSEGEYLMELYIWDEWQNRGSFSGKFPTITWLKVQISGSLEGEKSNTQNK